MDELVECVTCTVSACSPEYVFEIVLSDLQMEELRSEYLLGFRFKKTKYRFLNDLSDVLAAAILKELEKVG